MAQNAGSVFKSDIGHVRYRQCFWQATMTGMGAVDFYTYMESRDRPKYGSTIQNMGVSKNQGPKIDPKY